MATWARMTKTLLQNIEVLSAGQDFKKDAEGKPITVQVVNMLVTPEQAEQLSLARSQTTVQLVLRNPLDFQETKTPGTALAYLFTWRQAADARASGVARAIYQSRRARRAPKAPPAARRRAT